MGKEAKIVALNTCTRALKMRPIKLTFRMLTLHTVILARKVVSNLR